MTIGTTKLEESDVIVLQNILAQSNRSSCIFEGIFEELELINDTKRLLFHENWTLRYHQLEVRNDFEDESRP